MEPVLGSIENCPDSILKNSIRCILVRVVSFDKPGSLADYNLLNHSDKASTQLMENKIKLLNEQLDNLNLGYRKLHDLYDTRGEQIQNLQSELNTCENRNESSQVFELMVKGMIKINFDFSTR